MINSPGSSPVKPGKVGFSAILKAPRAAKIRSARFFVNGKLITSDRSYPFATKKGFKFDTRKLPASRPYITLVASYVQIKRNGKTVQRKLSKRVRVRFVPSDTGPPPPSWQGYKLALDEEFNGDALDTSLWNDQRQDSIDQDDSDEPALSRPFNVDEGAAYGPDNVTLADGALNLTLLDTPAPDPSAADYDRSTGMVNTNGKFAFKYGYVETRAWVPDCMGCWPTFWMMPANNDDWPPEIDIFEYVCIPAYPARYPHAVFHWAPDGPEGDDQFQHTSSEDDSGIPSPKPQEWFTTRPMGQSGNYMGQWHTYGLLWTPDRAVVYFDGQPRVTVYGASKLPQQSMYLIYQMAIMKPERGVPPAGSAMKIDYLRVYSNETN